MAGESFQETEISSLRSSFDGQVNDIKGVGDFTHVLSLRPKNMDLQCKFQMSASYPAEPPLVSVRSSVLSPEEVADLVLFLQTATQNFVGGPMILDVTQKGIEWLRDNEINAEPGSADTHKVTKKGKHKKRSKGGKEKQVESQDEEKAKKPPMKTASDVIKRLQWDPDVCKEDFIVGYMDRLVGLQEREFTAFTWEDLASVDHFALAIPQHRIQYFKYKSIKVWDKNERLDNVFGSTGSGITVTEAAARYDASVETEDDRKRDGCIARKGEADEGERDVCYEETCGDRENETEIEEIGKLDEACGIDSREMNNNETEIELNIETGRKGHKKEKSSNYFLGIKLQDEETVKNLVDVQRQLIEHYPFYKDYVINKNGFHLTLRLLNLKSDDDIRNCVRVMKQISHRVESIMKKIESLRFVGLDHFGANVVFAKVKYTRAFLDLLDYITQEIVDAGVKVVSHNLNPHITLFKVPRSERQIGKKEPPILLRYSDTEFGVQAVDHVYLCQMGTMTETSDFYTIASAILLQK